MKKLCIITLVMFFTAIYAADTSSIRFVIIQEIASQQRPDMKTLKIKGITVINQINLDTETFQSIAEKVYNKIYNSDEFKGKDFHSFKLNRDLPLKEAEVEIEKFEWCNYDGISHSHSSDDSTTLRASGIRDGQVVSVPLIEAEEFSLIKDAMWIENEKSST